MSFRRNTTPIMWAAMKHRADAWRLNIYTIRGIGGMGHLVGPPVATWALRGARRSRMRWRECAVSCITLMAPRQPESWYRAGAATLSRPDRPSAVFASTDLYAKVVYQAAKELNLSIPGDLAVVGFSDHDFALELCPPLTSEPSPDIKSAVERRKWFWAGRLARSAAAVGMRTCR